MAQKKTIFQSNSGKMVLGRGAMDKISAVEGIRRTSSSVKMFKDFDRKGLNQEERRRAMLAAHAKKA